MNNEIKVIFFLPLQTVFNIEKQNKIAKNAFRSSSLKLR